MFKQILILGTLFLAACGSSPVEENSVDSVKEGVTAVTVYEWMKPGTAVPTGNAVTLYEDPARPTPLLTATTVFNTTGNSTYSTNSDTAVAFDTADWATMKTYMNNCLTTGNHMKIILTYDNGFAGTTKPLIANPGGVPRFVLCGSDPNCSL